MRAHRPAHALLSIPLLVAAACIDAPINSSVDASSGANGSNGNGNGSDDCSVAADLDPAQFESDVLPGLEASCGGGSCHAPGSNQYEVHGGAYQSDDTDEQCAFADSIDSFVAFADRETPDQSPILLEIDGTNTHGGPTWEPGQPPRPAIEAYLETIAGGGNGNGNGDGSLAAFESDIQPILDSVGGEGGCAAGGGFCHDNGIGGFELIAEPAAGSADMQANYDAVVGVSDPASPEDSRIIVKGTTSHSQSPEFSAGERQTIVDWIGTLGP